MHSFFSTHSGAGGACLGAEAAGLKSVGGIEIDDYCVGLHRNNFGDGIRHESILDTPIEQLPDFDFLWTSPTCVNFSTAKTDGKELDLDIQIAEKIADIIRIKKPRYFVLENVRGYVDSASFRIILSTIQSLGYNNYHAVYDAADWGVPQNRHRLILRASRDPLRDLLPTHSKTGGLWWQLWNGWYNTIADLLPSCKPSHLTERQIQALENKGWYGDILKGLAVSSEYMGSNGAIGRADELPIGTITTQSKPAAVLVEGKDSPSRDRTLRNSEEPCMTITANQGGGGRLPKVVLVDGKGNNYASSYTAIDGADPSFTVTANMDRNISRAVLVEGNKQCIRVARARDHAEPSPTICASADHPNHLSRAIIIERTGYGDRDPITRQGDEPSQTIRASVGCDERGGFRSPITALLESADVRALDYRCLARLQSFPDSYEWGKSAGKNCRAIGNAVPVLFAQRIIESIIGDQT
jgi:DNA (cytosine-5)-methyltransferase 1